MARLQGVWLGFRVWGSRVLGLVSNGLGFEESGIKAAETSKEIQWWYSNSLCDSTNNDGSGVGF